MRRSTIIWTVLVMLVALGLLASLAIPVSSDHPICAKTMQANATMQGIVWSLVAYREEYNRLPVEAVTGTDENVWQRTQGTILETLMANNLKTNPSKIRFYDPLIAKNHCNGIYEDAHGALILVDPWGEPYYYIMDLNGDGKVPNPDPRSNHSQPFLKRPIIIFSAGPDRDPNTWDDNVLSRSDRDLVLK